MQAGAPSAKRKATAGAPSGKRKVAGGARDPHAALDCFRAASEHFSLANITTEVASLVAAVRAAAIKNKEAVEALVSHHAAKYLATGGCDASYGRVVEEARNHISSLPNTLASSATVAIQAVAQGLIVDKLRAALPRDHHPLLRPVPRASQSPLHRQAAGLHERHERGRHQQLRRRHRPQLRLPPGADVRAGQGPRAPAEARRRAACLLRGPQPARQPVVGAAGRRARWRGHVRAAVRRRSCRPTEAGYIHTFVLHRAHGVPADKMAWGTFLLQALLGAAATLTGKAVALSAALHAGMAVHEIAQKVASHANSLTGAQAFITALAPGLLDLESTRFGADSSAPLALDRGIRLLAAQLTPAFVEQARAASAAKTEAYAAGGASITDLTRALVTEPVALFESLLATVAAQPTSATAPVAAGGAGIDAGFDDGFSSSSSSSTRAGLYVCKTPDGYKVGESLNVHARWRVQAQRGGQIFSIPAELRAAFGLDADADSQRAGKRMLRSFEALVTLLLHGPLCHRGSRRWGAEPVETSNVEGLEWYQAHGRPTETRPIAIIGCVAGAQAVFNAGGARAVVKALDAACRASYQVGLDWYEAHGLPAEKRPIQWIGGVAGAQAIFEEEGPQGVLAALDEACELRLQRHALCWSSCAW